MGQSEWSSSHLSPGRCLGLGYDQGPSHRWELWSSHRSLCWCLRLLLPVEDVEGSVVWAATWGGTLVFEGFTATGACQFGRAAQSSSAMVTSWPLLLLRTMSGSCHRVVCVNVPGQCATRRHTNTWGLGHSLWLCWCPRAMLQQGSCPFRWPALPPQIMEISRSKLLPRTISGSIAYHSQGSVIDVYVPCCHQRPLRFPGSRSQPVAVRVPWRLCCYQGYQLDR